MYLACSYFSRFNDQHRRHIASSDRKVENLGAVQPQRDVENVAYINLPFDDVRYSPHASSKVSYFLFFVADVKCGLYETRKRAIANALQLEGLSLIHI